jgi:hypothetical protein
MNVADRNVLGVRPIHLDELFVGDGRRPPLVEMELEPADARAVRELLGRQRIGERRRRSSARPARRGAVAERRRSPSGERGALCQSTVKVVAMSPTRTE